MHMQYLFLGRIFSICINNIHTIKILYWLQRDINFGCLVNYEYVYCPGGTKIYGTGGKFAMGQSITMFME
jgi:hypothetical protein